MTVGGLTAVIVGFSFDGLPLLIHLPLAVLAGFVGGALWGFIPGILRAKTGAHEVTTTIMLNSVAAIFIGWVIVQSWAEHPERQDPISQRVDEAARLPRLFAWLDSGLRVHAGIVLAVLAVAAVQTVGDRPVEAVPVADVAREKPAAVVVELRPKLRKVRFVVVEDAEDAEIRLQKTRR
jgi:simple sugar transport system permease protein